MYLKYSHRDKILGGTLYLIFAFLLITGDYAQGEASERLEMKNNLIELSYRQIGSGNRVHIIINKSKVTISGQGGYKRGKFSREKSTPASLWVQLTQQAEIFAPGEIQFFSESEAGSQIREVRAIITIQTADYIEKTRAFSHKDPPNQFKALINTIFLTQSPLEEIVYSENGMSEHLKLKVSRERTEVDSNSGSVNSDRYIDVVTPADYWESLVVAVRDIEIEDLENMEAPSNRRSTDASLYASLKIKFNGEWYMSKSFDDNKPPEPLRQLISLLNSARYGSFRKPRAEP